MVKQAQARECSRWGFGVSAILGLIILAGCGGGSGPTGNHQPVISLVTFGEDEPQTNLLSLHVTYSVAGLVQQSGPAAGFVDPLTFQADLAGLRDFTSILDSSITPVPSGTYNGMTLLLSNPILVVLDTSQSPPVPKMIPAQLTNSTVTVPLSPPLTVTDGASLAVLMDFNLAQSVETDANGQITGTINPTVTARLLTASGMDGFGTFDDLHGRVFSVDTSSLNGFFTDGEPGDTEPLVLVSAHSFTQFEGVAGLGSLQRGDFVDATGVVDKDTLINARTVQLEAHDDASLGQAAFLGLVTSVTRNTSGAATQLTLLVREQDPELSGIVATGSAITVNVAPSATFTTVAPETNFSTLSFGAAQVAIGENVSAHGVATAGSPVTVAASDVLLRRQSISGTFSTLLGAAADQKTGGFTITPDSGLYQGQTITVYTSAQTNFLGVINLPALSSGQKLIVKGHLFFEATAGSVNGIAWTPPALVFVCEQVHAP